MQRRLTIEELLGESGWLRTLAGHLVADASRADDLVQDTWLTFAPNRPFELRIDALRFETSRFGIVAEEEVTVALRHSASVEVIVSAGERDLTGHRVVVSAPPELWRARSDPLTGMEEMLRLELSGKVIYQFGREFDERSLAPDEKALRLNADGRAYLEGVAPGVQFAVELRDPRGKSLATRTTMIAPGEWQTIEFDLR